MSQHNRRDFLRLAALGTLGSSAALAACTSGGPDRSAQRSTSTSRAPHASGQFSEMQLPAATRTAAPASERALVVIEMAGGNDGFSMVPPSDDAAFRRLRRATAITDGALEFPGSANGFALHPDLASIQSLPIAALVGIGVNDPDESHFEMQRRWAAGDGRSVADSSTGFLGRLTDAIADPEAPAAGVSVSGASTPALVANRATTLFLAPWGNTTFPAPGDEAAQAAWQRAHRAAAAAGVSGDAVSLRAARAGMTDALHFATRVDELPEPWDDADQSELGQQLALAARLLDSDLGVRVIHVAFDGDFDTHEGHVERYAALMAQLGPAIASFFSDLDHRGLEERVVLATTSEFGRRMEPNGDDGLDHGSASTMLLAGAVNVGVHGDSPRFDQLDVNGNVGATVTMERYYATLATWLDIDPSQVLATNATPIEGILNA